MISYEGLAEHYGIRLLLQFGSTVTGTTHPGSDIDLAAVLDRAPVPPERLERVQSELQALHSGRTVDLVLLNHADPLLLKKATEHCKLLYGSLRDLQELQILAFKQYQDHKRYFELEREYVGRVFHTRS